MMRFAVVGLFSCFLSLLGQLALATDYALSYGRYWPDDDLLAAVWNEFHDEYPGAVIADWQDIVDTCEQIGACQDLADELDTEAAQVFRNGRALCPNGQYFVYRIDDPPSRYQVIARVASHSIWLLCGPIEGPFLAKLPDVSEPAGLVAPDLGLYLPHLQWFAPRRVRNISARLSFHGFSPTGEMLWRLEEYGDRPED